MKSNNTGKLAAAAATAAGLALSACATQEGAGEHVAALNSPRRWTNIGIADLCSHPQEGGRISQAGRRPAVPDDTQATLAENSNNLADQGVPLNRMDVVSWGETKAPNPRDRSSEALQQSRRVDLVVVG